MSKNDAFKIEHQQVNSETIRRKQKNVVHLFFVINLIVLAIPILALPQHASGANEMCPVLPQEKVDTTIFTEYEGKRIYFCCARCRRQFLENSAKYKSNLLQFDLAPALAGTGHTNELDTHNTTELHIDENAERENEDHQSSHDHNHDHTTTEGLSRMLQFIGKFHPMVIHFPIVLILLATLMESLAIFVVKDYNKIFLCQTGVRYSLLFAAISAIVSVAFGWAAAAFAHYPDDLNHALTIHRWLGTSTGILVCITWLLAHMSEKSSSVKFKYAYRILLFACAAIVSATGHFGATLIYGSDYFTY